MKQLQGSETPLVCREPKLECSFKSEEGKKKSEQKEAELPRSAVTTEAPSLLLVTQIDAQAADAHCREMKRAAGPGAADELSRADHFSSTPAADLLLQRVVAHRPGSCCSLIRLSYCRLIGSLLSERESPHWI